MPLQQASMSNVPVEMQGVLPDQGESSGPEPSPPPTHMCLEETS